VDFRQSIRNLRQIFFARNRKSASLFTFEPVKKMKRIGLLILILGSLLAGRLGIIHPPATECPFSVVQERKASEQPTLYLVETSETESLEEEQEEDPSDEGTGPEYLPIQTGWFPKTLAGFQFFQPNGPLWVHVRNRVIQHRNIRI
jgi:hypothetical protein